MPDPIETLYVEIDARADKLIAEAKKGRAEATKALEDIGDATDKVESKFSLLEQL